MAKIFNLLFVEPVITSISNINSIINNGFKRERNIHTYQGDKAVWSQLGMQWNQIESIIISFYLYLNTNRIENLYLNYKYLNRNQNLNTEANTTYLITIIAAGCRL